MIPSVHKELCKVRDKSQESGVKSEESMYLLHNIVRIAVNKLSTPSTIDTLEDAL
jgi:hypothetical protein